MGAPERWLPVPGYEGWYEVSDLGRLRSLPHYVPTNGGAMRLSPGKALKGGTYKDGHKHVTFSRENKHRTFTVHNVVLTAFVGPRPEGLEACHGNGDPADNRLENLRWDTSKSNAADRAAHGRTHESNVTQCPQEHEYTPENTYVTPAGHRQCKTCRDGGRPAPPCSKCDKPAKSHGLCATHDMARRRALLSDEKRDEIRRKDAERARQKRRESAA